VNLRGATADDVAAVHALEVSAFGADAWSAASVAEELTGRRRTAVVACDPHVVGYAVASTVEDPLDAADLQRIAVHPAHRRRGLARALLAAVAEDAGRMLLEVSAGNTAALAFYAEEGFVEIDRRPRYYRDGSDAVVMERAAPR
jgi:ribosomal-protein-alanine N-acetyltransferase